MKNYHMRKELYITRLEFNDRFDRLEKSIEDLAAMVARGFRDVEERFDNKLDSLEQRMNQKFDGVHARIDDVVMNRATRTEVLALEKRVSKIEEKFA